MPERIALAALIVTLATGVAVAAAPLAEPGSGGGPAIGTVVPVGAHVRFHLDAPLSSAKSTTGERFTFTLIDPIAVGPAEIARAGARGHGTVLLAGHAGAGGHEGDLTLRLDYVETPARSELGFNDARFEMNGTNHKIASGVLGFVPYAGLGSHFIRGREMYVGTDVPVLFVTTRPATVMSEEDAKFLTPPVPVPPSRAPKVVPSAVPTDAASPAVK